MSEPDFVQKAREWLKFDERCSLCRAMRVTLPNGVLGVCLSIGCKDPAHDYLQEHSLAALLASVAAGPSGVTPEQREWQEKFPVKTEWGHDKLENVLQGAAGLLDTIKGEWAEEWSEWDQSVRNGITQQLVLLAASPKASVKGTDGGSGC